MYLPQPTEGGNFKPVPSGAHPAICCRVIDLGTQVSNFQGETKRQHKVMLSWEIADPDLKMDDGRPFTISQRYTLSMHEKATLRKHLEAWRGKAFVDSDFGEGGFDIKKLLLQGCLLSVVETEKEGKTYSNITGIMKLPKGFDVGALVNEPVYLALTPDRFEREQFAKLSDKLQDMIRSSPEYQALGRPAETGPIGDADDGRFQPLGGRDDLNDDIPF